MAFPRYMQQVGQNIRKARLKAGLRQVDLEEAIGLNYRHYQNIEAGRTNITLKTLFRLARLFKVSVEELVSVDE